MCSSCLLSSDHFISELHCCTWNYVVILWTCLLKEAFMCLVVVPYDIPQSRDLMVVVILFLFWCRLLWRLLSHSFALLSVIFCLSCLLSIVAFVVVVVVVCCCLLLLLLVAVVGCCCWLLLVVGCWLLVVVGCWLLVVGCWLLVVG